MNTTVKRKAGRRETDKVLEVRIDQSVMDLLKRSPEMNKATKELAAGRLVRLAPDDQIKSNKVVEGTLRVESKALQNTNKLVTMLAGGTTLGLAALAVAPASLIGVVVAAGVGVALGNAATRFDHVTTATTTSASK